MVPSIISADLKITGNLESAGEIQVDGHVAGDIRAKILLVGSSAKVDGEIFAETLRVHGNVNGQITAKFVNLAKTARVIGDIHHENLSIQEGAFLEGRMVHIPAQAVKAEVPAAVATAQTPPQPVETASSDGKPAEDRVNLVVKSGKQDQPNKPVPTPPLSPPNSSAGKAAS